MKQISNCLATVTDTTVSLGCN